MITTQQFQLIYPSIASFNSDNSYVRVSNKGKKHLVKKKNTKRNLLLAGGIATALTLGGVALYKREKGLLKKAAKTTQDTIKKGKDQYAKSAQQNKEYKKQLDDHMNKFKADLDKRLANAQNPTPAQQKEFDDFMKSGKTLIL